MVRRAPRRRSHTPAETQPPTSVRFPPDIRKWIDKRAKDTNVSNSLWIISVMQAYKEWEEGQKK